MILTRDGEQTRFLSRHLMDPVTGLAYNEPAPHNFSFNTPKGACPHCKGLGTINQIDFDKIIPDRSLSIAAGGIAPLGKEKSSMIFWQISAIGDKYGFTTKTPIAEIPEEGLDEILNGTTDELLISNSAIGNDTNFRTRYEGLVHYISLQQEDGTSTEQRWADSFYTPVVCPHCNGTRLNKEALSYRIADKNIAELALIAIKSALDEKNVILYGDEIACEICPDIEKVNAKTAFDGQKQGDKVASDVVNTYIEYLACGLVNLINIFQPEVVCLGGGVSNERQYLLDLLQPHIDREDFARNARERTKIVIAKFRNDAGIIGAAMVGVNND